MGSGTHGFTYDPRIGEFLLTERGMRIPRSVDSRRQYSTNEGYRVTWDERVVAFIDEKKEGRAPHKQRYIGTFIADFHRTLVYGGIFLYPANADSPKGKLRLLYECNPASFILEQVTKMTKNVSLTRPHFLCLGWWHGLGREAEHP